MMSPIAIDRSRRDAGAQADARAGARSARAGLLIIIFPEGHAVSPGQKGSTQVGGAWLAAKTGAPVVPIAHNAGNLWRKNAFLKFPGTITVSIGKPIDPAGLKPEELNRRVEDWIEIEAARLPALRSLWSYASDEPRLARSQTIRLGERDRFPPQTQCQSPACRPHW